MDDSDGSVSQDSTISDILNDSPLDESSSTIYNSNKKRDDLARLPIHDSEEEETSDSSQVRQRRPKRISERSSLTHYYKTPNSKKGSNPVDKSNSGNNDLLSPPNWKYMHSSPNDKPDPFSEKTTAPKTGIQDKDSKRNKKYTSLIIFIGLFICCMVVYFSQETTNKKDSHKKSYHDELLKLKKDFPSVENWRAINVSVSKISDETKQPGVLLLIGESESSVNCFAKKLLRIFKSTPEDVNNLKERVLNEYLLLKIDASLSGTKSYGLMNIHKLDGESAMVFHGFCDNENSPYPNSLIVFTLTVPKDIQFQMEEAESIVEELLLKQWTLSLSEDKASPLISRIIGYNAYVPVESVSPCS